MYFDLFSLLTQTYCFWWVIIYNQSFIHHFNFFGCFTFKSRRSSGLRMSIQIKYYCILHLWERTYAVLWSV